LGQQERIPLGIEYVDRGALEEPIGRDFREATVSEIIRALLGEDKGYAWRVRDGVVNISHKPAAPGKENLFDRVLPDFRIPKCSVAEASNALYMSLNSQLHPEVTGYAGEYSPGSSRDLIGPLEVRNATVRDILNRLVNSVNRKAAWIVQVPPGHLDELPSGGPWAILEYESPPRQYAGQLLGRVFGR
jgi:hypothetical protein